jgi:hypothetical protein
MPAVSDQAAGSGPAGSRNVIGIQSDGRGAVRPICVTVGSRAIATQTANIDNSVANEPCVSGPQHPKTLARRVATWGMSGPKDERPAGEHLAERVSWGVESAAVHMVAPVLSSALRPERSWRCYSGPAKVRLRVEVVMEHVSSDAGR